MARLEALTTRICRGSCVRDGAAGDKNRLTDVAVLRRVQENVSTRPVPRTALLGLARALLCSGPADCPRDVGLVG
ncbi:hypothetical protein [Lysobacter gummosus]|uniref:hypothetical protein n=1 Tax=Lysobacter gummosus TaxID=262324 RepID=UPI0036335E9A